MRSRLQSKYLRQTSIERHNAMDVLKAQYEARAKYLEVAKAIVDTCASEDRAMTVDERI